MATTRISFSAWPRRAATTRHRTRRRRATPQVERPVVELDRPPGSAVPASDKQCFELLASSSNRRGRAGSPRCPSDRIRRAPPAAVTRMSSPTAPHRPAPASGHKQSTSRSVDTTGPAGPASGPAGGVAADRRSPARLVDRLDRSEHPVAHPSLQLIPHSDSIKTLDKQGLQNVNNVVLTYLPTATVRRYC